MGENWGGGEKWAKRGWGIGETSGIAHGMWILEGCGGMWLRKMGEKREGGRDEIPIFTAPFVPFFLEVEGIPYRSQISSPHSQTEKWEVLPLTNTHRHGG